MEISLSTLKPGVEVDLDSRIVTWIKDYASSRGLGLVIGISGGIDSALVSTLCAKTGLETHIVILPIQQNENEHLRALEHSDWLISNFSNVKKHIFELTESYEKFMSVFPTELKTGLSSANVKSRLRMTALYNISCVLNCLVVGTGNKIEDFGVGFFTKYGDGGVDISPIADLTKTEVRELSAKLGITPSILKAKPTDGLWQDKRTDEDQLGASYEELEWAMDFIDSGRDEQHINTRQKEVLKIYKSFHSKNLHKMIAIPTFKK